jgi:membrane-associated HD superfamily phosphohydrolase
MHPEIEKLIELALANGQVTEKERNVIFKKAFELGVDADEVEMVLDGKLHQLEASIPKEKEKVGNIKTCPACGASLKAFQITCVDCGHELSGTKANVTISKLLEEIEKINNKEILSPKILKGALGDLAQKNTIDMERNKLKSELINNYPIPINKEDLFEFLQVSCTQYSANGNVTMNDVWLKKSKEALLKAKLAFFSDDKYKLLNDYEILINKNEKNQKRSLVLVLFFCFFMFTLIGLMVIFGPRN